MKPVPPALMGKFFTTEPLAKPSFNLNYLLEGLVSSVTVGGYDSNISIWEGGQNPVHKKTNGGASGMEPDCELPGISVLGC